MARVFDSYNAITGSTGVGLPAAGTVIAIYGGTTVAGFDRTSLTSVYAGNVSGTNTTVTLKFFNSSNVQVGSTISVAINNLTSASILTTPTEIPENGYALIESAYTILASVFYYTWKTV